MRRVLILLLTSAAAACATYPDRGRCQRARQVDMPWDCSYLRYLGDNIWTPVPQRCVHRAWVCEQWERPALVRSDADLRRAQLTPARVIR